MKVGDIVKVNDGSFNLFYGGSGVPCQISGCDLKGRTFRTLLVGVILPSHYYDYSGVGLSYGRAENDLMLCEVTAPEHILFTQSRLCTILSRPTPAIKAPPSDHAEVVVPFGTETVTVRVLKS